MEEASGNMDTGAVSSSNGMALAGTASSHPRSRLVLSHDRQHTMLRLPLKAAVPIVLFDRLSMRIGHRHRWHE
jgi:hypothetical protein